MSYHFAFELCYDSYGYLPRSHAHALATNILAGYSRPGRYYHTIYHAAEVVSRLNMMFAQAKGSWGEIAQKSLIHAAWLHDMIYDAKRLDNEEESAAWALALMPEELDKDIVRNSILGTKIGTEPSVGCPGILRDCDLACMAVSYNDFVANGELIRREYAHVPDEDFKKGRTEFFTKLLQAPIYSSFHREAWEDVTRRNIQRWLAENQPPHNKGT